MDSDGIDSRVRAAREATLAPTERAAAKLAQQGKLFVRERIDRLFDEGSFVEDGQLANALAEASRRTGSSPGAGWWAAGRRSWWPTTPV